MDYSNFGTKFTQPNGITQLIEDLGDAKNSNNPNIVMLGGGNPALVPEVNNFLSMSYKSLLWIIHFPTYLDFTMALRVMAAKPIFLLFNLLAGSMPDGSHKKVLFPLAPDM